MNRLLLLVLVVGILAVQDSQLKQKNLEGDKYTPLMRALTTMAYLQEKSQQIDGTRLINAVEELGEFVLESKREEAADYEKSFNQFTADSDFFEGQVTQYKGEVAAHEVDLSDLLEARTSAEKLLAQNLSEQGQTQDLTNELTKQIAEDEKIVNSQVAEYDEAIGALDEAIQLMASHDSSLVQVEQSTIQELNDKLAQKLKKRRVFYQPIVKALTQLFQSNFANQELSLKVKKLLNELRASLVASKSSVIASASGIRQKNDELLADYQDKLQNLAEIIIPAIKEEIEVKNGQVQTKSQLLNDAKNNLQTAEDNVKSTNDAWIARQNLNNKLMKQYDFESQQIQLVMQTFERAGIKKQ